ncbi:MAG: acyl carrier protein [Pseudomonadales bacterium]|jgi:hypothetical protein|nr:acyl carrier protein [Pseudomonadales bacterium]
MNINTHAITLKNIWSRVLCIPADLISAESNFFHMGGNSMALLQIDFSIRQTFQVSLSVSLLYSHPQFQQQLALVEQALSVSR